MRFSSFHSISLTVDEIQIPEDNISCFVDGRGQKQKQNKCDRGINNQEWRKPSVRPEL